MARSESAEPPEAPEARLEPSSALLVGRNRHGLWVVRDPHGMRGGLFSSRAEAFRFATLHHGCPRAAIMVPYLIEFDFRTPAIAANDTALAIGSGSIAGRSGGLAGWINAHV